MPDTQTHVIVGAGLAGAKAAEALRAEGFEGSIVLVGDEPELPYERPPLSKDYLRGESPREKARVHPEDFYSANGIDLHASTMVSEIDTVANDVVLSTGDRVGYDRLLLSLGAAPRRLAVPGAELDGVHDSRDLSDDAGRCRRARFLRPRLLRLSYPRIGRSAGRCVRNAACCATPSHARQRPCCRWPRPLRRWRWLRPPPGCRSVLTSCSPP